MEDLSAGFSGRDIDVCPDEEGPATPPLATVEISSDVDPTRVSVEIRDTLTNKRVGRDVDLEHVPEDGRAFAIALATDELVWASWAELALERTQRSETSPPPEVKQAIDKQLPPPAVRHPSRVGLHAAGERYSGGQRQLGLDGTLLLPTWQRIKLELSAGVRQGLEQDAANGTVHSNAANLAMGLRYLLLAGPRTELGLGASAQASWMTLRGEAPEGARADELAGPVIYARGSLSFDLCLFGPVWLSTGMHAGAPLRGLEASSDGQVVTGASKLLLAAQAGLSVEL